MSKVFVPKQILNTNLLNDIKTEFRKDIFTFILVDGIPVSACLFLNNASPNTVLYTVPAGKTLFLTNLFAHVDMTPYSSLKASVTINNTDANNTIQFIGYEQGVFPPYLECHDINNNYSIPLKLKEGNTIIVNITGSPSGLSGTYSDNSYLKVGIQGYLVDSYLLQKLI